MVFTSSSRVPTILGVCRVPSNSSNDYVHTKGSFAQACGDAAGNIGFGGPCGPAPSNQGYPRLTLAEAQAICCELHAANSTCDGMSIEDKDGPDGKRGGCFKKNINCGRTAAAGFDGYALPKSPPGPAPAGGQCITRLDHASAEDPQGAKSAVLLTAHVAKGRLAVVVLASWCGATAHVDLAFTWSALGLDAAATEVAIPAIAGLQKDGGSWPAMANRSVAVAPGQGVVLVVKPQKQAEEGPN